MNVLRWESDYRLAFTFIVQQLLLLCYYELWPMLYEQWLIDVDDTINYSDLIGGFISVGPYSLFINIVDCWSYKLTQYEDELIEIIMCQIN